MPDKAMKRLGCPSCTRRGLLRGGLGAAAAGTAGLTFPGVVAATAGATDNHAPYPIPWLDRNRHHNQVPMPDGGPTELSHIYHFNGQVGRALLTGEGTTGDGQTLTIGAGTDFGFMSGEYLTANGDTQLGAFTHI